MTSSKRNQPASWLQTNGTAVGLVLSLWCGVSILAYAFLPPHELHRDRGASNDGQSSPGQGRDARDMDILQQDLDLSATRVAPRAPMPNITVVFDAAQLAIAGTTCSWIVEPRAKDQSASWRAALKDRSSLYAVLPDRCRPHGDQLNVLASDASTSGPFVAASGGFAIAAFSAWAQERPLRVRPDDIWTMLLQQVSWHINKHAEDYRSLFVSHEGKEEVELGYDVVPPWPVVVREFVATLHARVKPGVLATFQPSFTTTTDVDGTVQSVLLMDTMRAYFEFGISITCGLPSVTLLGTTQDWEELARAWTRLQSLLMTPVDADAEGHTPVKHHATLRPWLQGVGAVLDKLNQTRAGEADTAWWASIVKADQKEIPAGCGGRKIRTTIDGWLPSLLLYLRNGELRRAWPPTELNDLPSIVAAVPVNVPFGQVLLLAGTPGYTVDAGGEPGLETVAAWAVVDADGVRCRD